MDRSYLLTKITTVKAQIDAYEAVLDFFAANNAVNTYSLDTGQSRQTVTRAQISSIKTLLDNLYNRLATFEARLYGAGVTARPGW